MIYSNFDNLKISKLGMGNMRLPTKDVDGTQVIDFEKGEILIDNLIKSGVNYFDTAFNYHGGTSEAFLGKALKKHPRESFYLATKFNIYSEPDYKKQFEKQLSDLQTDYIDFYLIHCILDDSIYRFENEGAIAYFEQMQAEGKIKYLGFSSHASISSLDYFCQIRKWDFAQIQFNYFDYVHSNAKKEYETLQKYNIPTIVMEPVHGGKLSSLTETLCDRLTAIKPNKSVSSWGFDFVKNFENVFLVLSGMTTMEQILDNLDTFSYEQGLSPADVETILKVAVDFKKSITVPCTACEYCLKHCPQSLPIPHLLSVYNKNKEANTPDPEMLKDVEENKLPSNCIKCGKCESVCPQKIKIVKVLEELNSMRG